MQIYNNNIYSWPWNCCWKTSQDIARHFNLKTEVGDEFLNLPTEHLAVQKLLDRYGNLLSGFKYLALETGFKEMPDDGKYHSGDIGIFQNHTFGAMTIFYPGAYGPPEMCGAWLVWLPLGMREFNKEFHCDLVQVSIFRGRV